MSSKLLAISDLHVGYEQNLQALSEVAARPDDYLILGGDICEKPEHLKAVFDLLNPRFKKLFWVPGNHELWTVDEQFKGEDKYNQMIGVCRSAGVISPEDPFLTVRLQNRDYVIAPLFVLYDYSFRPAEVSLEGALGWAAESGIQCADEVYIHPSPHASLKAWCEARVQLSLERLRAIQPDASIVLVNHFPLREDLIHLPFIPRFRIWCGTKMTETWHKDFPVTVAVSGHLHYRRTDWRDGVRFEEVSLGYPRQWQRHRGVDGYIRQILPYEGESE